MKVNFKSAFFVPFVLTSFARPVFADLPDLRGQTLFLTGTFKATGSALGVDIKTYFPNGIPISSDNPAQLVFAMSGSADNSTLTAQFPLPPNTTVVNGITYPGCANPSITLTGSFNRTNGVFHMVGALPGTPVFDFGVYDTTIFGVKRVLVQVKNLAVTLDGSGSVDTNGQFAIVQPGDSPFTFDVSSNFFTGTPKLGLQTPSSCGFGGTTATISNPTLKLSNWRVAQPVISGTVMLEGSTQPAQPVTFLLNPATGMDSTLSVTLDANGMFHLYNLIATDYTVRVKGKKWLRTATAVTTLNHDVPNFVTTLPAGDLDDNNIVDVDDLTQLLFAFNSVEGDGLYTDAADVNLDGKVDVDDLTLLLFNFNVSGQ